MAHKKLLFGCLAALSLAFAACDSTPDIAGTWTGSPQSLTATGVQAGQTIANSQITTSYTFVPLKGSSKEGTIELSSNIALIDATPLDSVRAGAYELSVAATATATGTYTFKDDDDILVSVDPNSIKVNVDPQGVSYGASAVTGSQLPTLEAMRPQLARFYAQKITMMVQQNYAAIQRIDDIKIHKDMLSCEIADRDFTLRRAAK